MGKLSTPDWIREGYDSPQEYNKAKGIKSDSPVKKDSIKGKGGKSGGKTYRIKICAKCGSNEVSVVLRGEEGKKADEWECRKCKWKGRDVKEKEVSEDEFLEMMEK